MDLTCVINVRNGERYLEETLLSISRSSSQVRILVVDNHSTDNTSRIAANFESAIYVRTPEPLSLGAARNYSLQFVTTEYITWLDADDKWTAGFFDSYSRASGLFPHAVMISSGSVIIDAHGKILPTKMQRYLSLETQGEVIPGDSLERLMDRISFADAWCSYVFKTDALRAIGGINPEFEFAEDIDVIGRLLTIGAGVHIQKNLTLLRYHSRQMTRTLPPTERSSEILAALTNAANRSGRSFNAQLATAEAVLRFKSAIQAVMSRPYDLGALARLIRSVASVRIWKWFASPSYVAFILRQIGVAKRFRIDQLRGYERSAGENGLKAG